MLAAVKLAAIVIIGVATWYGPGFEDKPLYCGGAPEIGRELRYNKEVGHAWIAVDASLFDEGWQCGDRVRLDYGDIEREYVVLDAGNLNRYCVEDQPEKGECGTIVVDVSRWYWPFDMGVLSAPVRTVNLSLAKRLLQQRLAP